MSALSVNPPFPIFLDIDGQPLDAGFVYLGVANQATEANPIQAYWDAALSVPATQPILTRGGFPVNAGVPARVYVNSDYSIVVKNRNGFQVFSSPIATDRFNDAVVNIDSSDVTFLQAGTGAVARTAQDKMRDVVSVKDFGAAASPTPSAAAFQLAINDVVTDATTLGRGAFDLIPGVEYSVATQLELDKKTLLVRGNNSILKWAGNNSTSMLHITDSARCRIQDLILIGDLTNPPVSAINLDRVISTGEIGTNENCIIDNVTIGRKFTQDTTTGGTVDATPYGRVQNGILVGGIDGNNDELTVSNTQVHGATVAGISFLNTQSRWSSLRDVLVNDSAIGLYAGCNLRLDNFNCNRNTTSDIRGVRETYTVLTTFNTENYVRAITSTGGASFFVSGGFWSRNDAVPVQVVRVENGGHFLLEDMTVRNALNTADTFYYRVGALLPGSFTVRRSNIHRGTLRDTWDIETGGATTQPYSIDIEVGKFRWKQAANSPYIDRAVTPPAVAASASGLIASGLCSSPFGVYFNVSYQLPLQGQHLTVAYDSASQIRARLLNPTGASITLAAGRMRWMAFEDHIARRCSVSLDAPSTANGVGTTLTATLPGAQLGDYVAYSVGANYMNSVVTCYVSAADTIAVRVHNASGGTSNPAATVFGLAVLREFGNYHGVAAYTPAAIANGDSITVVVPVVGAQLGGHVFATYTADLQGMTHSAEVSAVDTVTVTVTNYTGGSVTLGAGYFKAMVAF